MSNHFEVIAVSSKGPALDAVSKESGVKTIGIDMTRQITPFSDLKALYNLMKLIIREKPLIVHTHTPKAGLLGMIAARIVGVPIRLHTIAGMPLLEATGLKRKLLDLTERITYKCATRVYPNSHGMREIVELNKYCKPTKLKVIGNGSSNGIDTNYFDPSLFTAFDKVQTRSSLDIMEDDIVYTYIGRIVKDKGIKELVIAFSKIKNKKKNVKLLLVGPYENDLDPLDDLTEREISNNPSIIWIGFQQDVRPYLAISDIFVFPSYREGFPNVVMQSGAMGIPSVVTDINGCNEIITEGENGFIVPVKDYLSLQNAMERLGDDFVLRSLMASKCRNVIIDKYKREDLWNDILKEYERLIDSLNTRRIFS